MKMKKNCPGPLIPVITIIAIVMALLLTLVACSSNTSITNSVTSQSSITPSSSYSQNITAIMDSNNSLIFHIQGSVAAPGKVMVQYWSQGVGPFVTAPISTTGTAFSLEVMQLRPSTQYNYQVFLETSSNATPVSQYQGTFTTGPLPTGLQNANIRVTQGTPTYGLLLLDYNCTNFNGAVAIDQDGKIVWYYQNDNSIFTISQEPDFNLVFNEIGFGAGYTMKEIAPDGTVLHSINDILPDGSVSAPHGQWNHEMLVLPDNKVLTIGAQIRSVNINGKNTLQTGGTIVQWDLNTNTVTQLASMFDLLNPVTDREAYSNVSSGGGFWQGSQNQYAGKTEDWTHTNSLDVLPNGDLLVSNRSLDQIIAIKPDFSGIDWTLGGVGSSFTFPNPDDQFYNQHYVRMLPNGDILLFDNGNTRPADQGGPYSRAEELKLNFNTMQATEVWQYRATPDLSSGCCGSAVRLSNGDTVVDFGDTPPNFTVVESDPSGKPVAITKISSPGKTIQYRATPIDSLNGEIPGSVSLGQ